MAPPAAPTLRPHPEHQGRADAEPIRTGGEVGGSRLAAVLAAAALGVLATAADAQTPRFELVGKLDGSAYSVVQAVTDDGRAGGFSFNSVGDPIRSFLWSSGSGRADITTSVDHRIGFAYMSRDLTSFAAYDYFSRNVAHHRFGGATRHIPSVFGRGAAPSAISADGNHFAGWEALQAGLRRPIAWSETTGMRLLPARPGDDSEAFGISDDGRFVVGRDNANNIGWVWDDVTGYTALPNAIDGGQYNTEARAVSPNGRIVIGEGAAEVTPGVFRFAPMRWIDGVPQSLGLLDGYVSGRATGMSDDGSVIVGVLFRSDFAQIPFAWTEDRGISLLLDYLSDMDVPLPSNTVGLQRPTVSANGLVFGGSWWAEPASQTSQGFIAAVPGPGSSLIGVALSVAVVAMRRRD